MKLEYVLLGIRAQGDSHGRRHDQATRSGQRIRLHSRRWRPGVVLSPQFRPGQLRRTERRAAGELRRRAVRKRPARRQRAQRKLIGSRSATLLLFDIDGTLVLTGGAGARALARAFEDEFGIADAFGTVAMAGRTDAWIVAQAITAHR